MFWCGEQRAKPGWLLVPALLLLVTGCSDEQIETTYGRRSGMFAKESVNGTAVLAGMFSRAGHRVRAKRVLSTTVMEKADVIVWAPDDFEPPSPAVIAWFDRWLWQGGRTLIYVGRDFDAAPGYYDQVIPTAPAKQVGELRSRRTDARAVYNNERSVMQKTADCRWFQIDNTQRLKTVNSLEGPFSEGVDASGVEIELRSRLRPKIYQSSYGEDIADIYDEITWDEVQRAEAEEDALWAEDEDLEEDESLEEDKEAVALLEPQAAEVLLRSGDDILISKQAYDQETDSHIVLVANGSFLLNLPLVNHEHRKLAARLVDQFEPPQTVVFVESTTGGPPITDKEPSASIPTGLTLFAQRPLDVILFHVVALAIILCLARWPIFGRPAKPPRAEVSDFGKHVEALGAMLRRTGNDDFATASLHHYQQQISDTQKVD